mgnify:CR=1 FL=1
MNDEVIKDPTEKKLIRRYRELQQTPDYVLAEFANISPTDLENKV